MAYKKSLYTSIGEVIKRLLCINDFSMTRKNIHKKIGKLIYHKKYSSMDLINVMQDMGLKKGSIICIHCSMKEFYNFTDSAEEFINDILNVIGPDGTLMMPSFPSKKLINKPDYIFDKDKDPTGAGYLAETFRNFPNVKRSINVQHSVCAIGKYANYLIKDHHKCHDCWGEDSPWMRFCELGGITFNLGLPRSYMGTFHHCVESKLQYEYPYWALFFTKHKTYLYYDNKRNICEYDTYEGDIDRRTREKRVTRFFDAQDWSIRKVSNLEIKAFYTSHCFPKMLLLGRKGIGVYYIPSTKGYSFSD